MRVFLTGGTGFIGFHLTRALLARGWSVTALVRRPEGTQARALASWGATLTRGDVGNRESMRDGMAGVDLVVHNAAVYEYGANRADQERMRATNEGGTEQVLSMAQELGIARVAYVSSVVVWGDSGPDAADETTGRRYPHASFYEASKERAHAVALDYAARGVPVTIACPSAVVGPNDHSPWGYFLRMYLNGIMPPFGFAADVPITPVHVADLAEGIALVADRGRIGESYCLAGEATSIRATLSRWSREPGGSSSRVYLPRWLAIPGFSPVAPLLRAFGLPAFISAEALRAAHLRVRYSAEKAHRELDWVPRSSAVMWDDIIATERALHDQRRGMSLLQRLKPVDVPFS